MTDDITRKEFPNGDVALDTGYGVVYRTPEAAYTVELDLPQHPLSDEPYGVDLVRATADEHGLERQQRLTLAEYRSYMAAEEHVREAERALLEQGRAGLADALALVDAMPYTSDEPLYLVGLYPPAQDADRATLNVLCVERDRVAIAPVAHGPMAEMAAIEQRLFAAQAAGDTDVFLKAATAEAVRSRTLAPHTPLFAQEGTDMPHPIDEMRASEEPERPPVTFGDDLTPVDAQDRYLPHHRDEAGTVHCFAVAEQELRYFRAQQTQDGVIHDAQPVMPVDDPVPSPWPLPALHYHLEEGDLDAAQRLARDTARIHDLPFPDPLPTLDEPDWTHFDTALVVATPQGVDDGHSVGVVDLYADPDRAEWAGRYLPLGEFDTLDDALGCELQVLQLRTAEREGDATGFCGEPALYARIAQAEADAALTDLLERHDGHLPPDYDGDHDPEWEPLTSKEWQAYRDYVGMVAAANPALAPVRDRLPTATPHMADDALVAGSAQPDAPYLQAQGITPQEVAPSWRLDIVPARDPDGEPLGYAAVCVVDFTDLAEAISPDAPERAQWLEVAQFQTEQRAQQFREDFMSLAGMEELSHIPGPAFAKAVADDLGMDSQWQTMDEQSLEQLKAGEWSVAHETARWQPRLDEVSPSQTVEATKLEIDL